MSTVPGADGPAPSPISAERLAAAAEYRTLQQPTPSKSAAQLAKEHERKQAFRRLIDPGIMRPNSKEQAIASLKILSTIADNLIREPTNPKFTRFKPTNNIIKRNLVEAKGCLEYAIEMGFRAEVEEFQPYYTFNSRRMDDLRLGAGILQEVLAREAEKESKSAVSKFTRKAEAEAVARQVKINYMDDRKEKILRDEMEKAAREGRALTSAKEPLQPVASTSAHAPTAPMPGAGRTVAGGLVPETQETEDVAVEEESEDPPYDPDHDDDSDPEPN